MEITLSRPAPALESEIVRAGAGAGKTRALVERVNGVIEHFRHHEKRWPKILVTTFTRKATQELRERLLLKAYEKNDKELINYISSRSRLHISTIHGVLALFWRRFGHLLGCDAGFKLISSFEAAKLRKQVIFDILQGEGASLDLLEHYTVDQLVANLTAYSEVIQAEPETRLVTVEDLRQATKRRLAPLLSRLEETLKALSAKNLTPAWQAYVDYWQEIKALLQHELSEESWQVLQNSFAEMPDKPRASAKNPDGVHELALSEIRKNLKNNLDKESLAPQFWPIFVAHGEKFLRFAEIYFANLAGRKRETGQFEMNDLELLTMTALRQYPAVASAFAQDWDYALIDEFQDTSPLQVQILRQLLGSCPLFVVGDPQQSIYLFRGARAEVFRQKQNEFNEMGHKQRELMTNYRARPELQHFMNDFFNNLSEQFASMEPRGETSDVTSVVARFCPVEGGLKELGRDPEYQFLLAHIQELCARPGVSLSDICILARKNQTLLDVAQFLKRHGLPTHVHGSRGYFSRQEVRDALAILKFLACPHDNENLLLLLRSPWCRVPDNDLAHILKGKPANYWQAVQESELNNLESVNLLQEWRQILFTQGYVSTWEKAIQQSGLLDLCAYHDSTGRREANLWKLVANFRLSERQPGFQVLNFIKASQWSSSVEDGSNEGDAVTALEPNVIHLLTVHGAKGLQWKHVLLPHCDEELHQQPWVDFAHMEKEKLWSLRAPLGEEGKLEMSALAGEVLSEEKQRLLAEFDRLLYVALTRAQESVLMSWTGEPKEESWAARARWPVTENGIQQRENYAYEVWRELPLQTIQRKPRDWVEVVPPPYDENVWAGKGSQEKLFSVTDLLKYQGLTTQVEKKFSPQSHLQLLKRAHFGTTLHKLFEQKRLNPEQDFSELLQAWQVTNSDEMLEALAWLEELQEPPMAELFEFGYAEWGFQLQQADYVVEGQIDLWGEVDGVTWVIDYKSALKENAPQAFAQLTHYAHALRANGADGPIMMAVVYPFLRQALVQELG